MKVISKLPSSCKASSWTYPGEEAGKVTRLSLYKLKNGQWLWLSWYNGYFQFQRSAVRIQSSAKIYIKHFIVNCIEKTKIKKKADLKKYIIILSLDKRTLCILVFRTQSSKNMLCLFKALSLVKKYNYITLGLTELFVFSLPKGQNSVKISTLVLSIVIG